MLILNTTFAIPKDIYKESMQWLTEHLIPAIKKENDVPHRLLFIHGHGGEQEDYSVSLQLEFPDREILNGFIENHNNNMIEIVTAKYNNKVLTFQTILEDLV